MGSGESSIRSGWGWPWVLLLLGLVAGAPTAWAKPPPQAELHVSDYGILGDRKLKKVLQLLEEPGKKPEFFDANFIEDGVLILMSRLNRDGYLKPQITARLTLADGRQVSYDWREAVREQPLPRPLQVRKVEFQIHKGVLYYFGQLQLEGLSSIRDQTARSCFVTIQTNTPFSKPWLEDLTQQLRATNYHYGYPDTTVQTRQPRRETLAGTIEIDLLARIKSGNQVRLGEVKFTGEKKTKESLMQRRVRLQEGSLLDRVQVEEGRYRLARLGVFDTVSLTYQPVDDPTRDVTYQVHEGKTIDFSFLFGYGSYELLRGGIELEQNNILGHAHHARLRLIQSIKASYGDYLYTMPELIARDVDVFVNGSALRREEIDFTREEFGGGFGARKYRKFMESDVTVRYSYQVLNASTAEVAAKEGLPNANVGAVITEIKHDRQDNTTATLSNDRASIRTPPSPKPVQSRCKLSL
jgi:outer membrane protein assembly factor BamA